MYAAAGGGTGLPISETCKALLNPLLELSGSKVRLLEAALRRGVTRGRSRKGDIMASFARLASTRLQSSTNSLMAAIKKHSTTIPPMTGKILVRNMESRLDPLPESRTMSCVGGMARNVGELVTVRDTDAGSNIGGTSRLEL